MFKSCPQYPFGGLTGKYSAETAISSREHFEILHEILCDIKAFIYYPVGFAPFHAAV
jgi:hypothetical protein